MSVRVYTEIKLEPIECYHCGTVFGISPQLQKNLRDNHRTFYCPNGHGQGYYGKSKAEKLEEQLEQEKAKLANAQFEIMMNEKKVKRLEKRIKNGVCPCCHRQFTQLTRHMQSKHPEYGKEK